MIPSFITAVLAAGLGIYVLIRRFDKGGKVENAPLGMPVGTVRAFLAVLIVSFPFGYLMSDKIIPSFVLNTIFVVMTFYFENRSEPRNLLQMIKDVRQNEQKKKTKEKISKPLYLPKFTVRITLFSMLIITLIINYYGNQVPFESTNTLLELLLIIGFYIVGMLFGGLADKIQVGKIKRKLKHFEGTDEELAAQMDEKDRKRKRNENSILSVLMIIAIMTSLTMFTLEYDYTIALLGVFSISIRGLLLLMINVYYGFRQ